MSRPYKIKRTKYTGPVKARPHPLFVVLVVLAVFGLGYLGFVSYTPIYNAIMNRTQASSQTSPPPQVPEASIPEEPEEAPPPEPEPAVPEKFRAIYLPAALLKDNAALNSFLEGLKDTSLNAVMVDIKDKSGQVLFASQNQQANKWQAVAPDAIDLSALAARLEEQGLSLLVRMSAFRDEMAAREDKQLAVNYRAYGTLWLDNFQHLGGKPWLNPYSAGAQQYLLDLALEAVDCGARLVVLDDFCFPPNSMTGDAFFGDTQGVSRADVLKSFAQKFEETLSQKEARGAVYLTGAALAGGPNPTLYGGEAADIAAGRVLLGALPYQFSAEGFTSGKLTLRQPLQDPADTVKQVANLALQELGDREVIALIQGGVEPQGVSYTAQQIVDQIKALEELGLEEYVLYCTDYKAYLLPQS